MADACLIPQVYNALRFNVEMGEYKNILKVWEHCNTLEAFEKAHPDVQPDTPEST
jgi:glutathione S-transferase